MGNTDHTRYVIVRHRPGRGFWLRAALVSGWVVSLVLVALLTAGAVAPQLPGMSVALSSSRTQLKLAQADLRQLNQQKATLERSDQISRVANLELQQALAERDEEIGDLRANLAFYERVAGEVGQQPKGLNVHSAEFKAEAAGTWRYRIVLTQNLEHGAVSTGKLRFAVEGVRNGKLTTVGWDDLHQRRAVPEQGYSFRYFQQLRGTVMLPPGFTPQRVRVSLRGGNASVDQALAWAQPLQNGDT